MTRHTCINRLDDNGLVDVTKTNSDANKFELVVFDTDQEAFFVSF